MHLSIERESDQPCLGKIGFVSKFAYLDYVSDDDYAHHWAHRIDVGVVDSIPFAVYRIDMELFVDDPKELEGARARVSKPIDESPWAIVGFFNFQGILYEAMDPSADRVDLSAWFKEMIRSRADAEKRGQPIWRLRLGGPIYCEDAAFRRAKGKWNDEIVPMDDSSFLVLERSGTHKGLKFAVYRNDYEVDEAPDRRSTMIVYDEKIFGLGWSVNQPCGATDDPPVFGVAGGVAERCIDASGIDLKRPAAGGASLESRKPKTVSLSEKRHSRATAVKARS